MRKLFIYLKEYKKETIFAPLFKLLEAFFELLVPLVVANIIDVGIPKGDMGYIGKMGACLLILAVVGLTAAISAQFFAAKAAVGFVKKIKHALFEHLRQPCF